MAPAKPNNREEDKMVRLGSTRKIRFNKKKCAEDILKTEATNMDLKCKVEALETAINQLQTILEEVKQIPDLPNKKQKHKKQKHKKQKHKKKRPT